MTTESKKLQTPPFPRHAASPYITGKGERIWRDGDAWYIQRPGKPITGINEAMVLGKLEVSSD